jgi:iron(III) transport system ATP-binding protein
MSVSINNLHFNYEKDHPILKGCSLDVDHGHIVAVLGQSGSGKSTLLRVIAGLERPSEGVISIDSTILNDAHHFVDPSLRKIGMVFQDYALFPHLTIEKNIAYSLSKYQKKEKQLIIDDLLNLIELPDKKGYYPHELSGGQQQRVALARSLAANPKVLLLDEPFSNLDADLRSQIRNDLKRILKEKNMTCIFATHDLEDAIDIADEIYQVKNGMIEKYKHNKNMEN